MNRLAKNHLFLAASVGVAVLTIVLADAKPAAADDLFLTSGSYDAIDAAYQNNTIYVGRDSNYQTSNNGVPYVATLNVKTGANVLEADGYNSNTMTISGGIVGSASGYNTSTTTISGGSVQLAYGGDTSTTNINGGSVHYATGYNTSTMNLSGGTLLSGLFLTDSAQANFIGTGLSYAYSGYGYNSTYFAYADAFTISGTFAGASQSYQLYVRNPDGASGTTNSTPRQFAFNGQSVTAVPEARTLALASIGFAVSGVGLTHRILLPAVPT